MFSDEFSDIQVGFGYTIGYTKGSGGDMRDKGDGTVFKDARGYWTIKVELPAHGGDRRRKVVRMKGTKQEALARLRAIRAELEKSGDLPTSSQTLETWLTYWLDHIAAKRVRPNTLDSYRTPLTAQVIPAIGSTRLEKLTPTHIRKMHAHILDQGLSSTYALNAHRVLSKALADAEREGRISRNPASLTDAPRKAVSKLEALSVGEAIKIIRRVVPALETKPYNPEAVLWAMYLMTGARRSELLGLERDRITDVIDLSWQLQRVPNIESAPADFEYRHMSGKLYLTRPKSSAGWRIIPLVEPLKTMLTDHLERMPSNEHGLVFGLHDPDKVSKRWPEALAEMGVTKKKVRLHDLRHTTVDLLYEAGVPEDIIIEIVGHSTRSMTRSYKSRGNLTRNTDAMLQLSALLAREPEGPPLEGV